MVVPEKFFEVEFSKAMAFGYRTEDVDEFVTKAIEIIKTLQEENQELMEKMTVLAQSLEKYQEDEESLRSAIIGAHKLGDSILKESKNKAEVILRDATTNADHIVEEAHARLEREIAEYERLKGEVTAFREGLFDMYKAHIDQITRLPHKEKQAPKAAAPAPAPAAAEPAPPPPPPPQRAPEPPEPVLTVEEPEEEYAPALPPEPPVKKAAHPKRSAMVLELEEDDEEEEEEEEVVTRYNGRLSRFSSPRQQPVDDFDDDDEDEEDLPPARTVFSSKFGEMRFGEGFSLTQDEHRSSASGRAGKRR